MAEAMEMVTQILLLLRQQCFLQKQQVGMVPCHAFCLFLKKKKKSKKQREREKGGKAGGRTGEKGKPGCFCHLEIWVLEKIPT